MNSVRSSEPDPSRASRIWRRTRVGGSLALVVGLLLWGASGPVGPYLVLGCGVAMALGCVVETRAMQLLPGPAGGRGHGLLLGVLAVLTVAVTLVLQVRPGGVAGRGTFWELLGGLILLVLAVGVLGLILGWVSRAQSLRVLASLLWIAVPLPALYLVVVETGVAGLGALILLSKVGDIAGYYSGNLLGDRFPHHPFPRLSPGKTSVGCLGSFIVGTAAGPLVAGWLPDPRWGWASALAAAALINLASQAGDLLESAGKRRAGVKDSGTLFGPSGGVLDVVDSLLLSVPMALITWPLLFEGLAGHPPA